MYTYVSNNPLRYIDPSGYCQEIGGSAFATRKIGSNGVLYTLDGNVAWDYYIAWRNKDKMAFDKMANSGKMKNKDQELIMRMTLSIFAHMDDGSLMLALSSNGQQGLAKGIMQKSGVKVGAKVVAKVTPKVAPKTAPKVASQGTGNLITSSSSYKGLAKNHSADDLIKNLEGNGWTKVVDPPQSAKSGEAIKFTNPKNGDIIRIMPNPADGKPYFKVQNKGGGWLDESGNFPSNATKQELRDLTHFYFEK